MNDKDLMLFGEHKGKKMANVPAKYLIWLSGHKWIKDDLKQYIKDNMDVLKAEVKREEK